MFPLTMMDSNFLDDNHLALVKEEKENEKERIR